MSVHNKLYTKDLYPTRVYDVTLSATDWGYLGSVDQNMSQVSNVTFADVTSNSVLASVSKSTLHSLDVTNDLEVLGVSNFDAVNASSVNVTEGNIQITGGDLTVDGDVTSNRVLASVSKSTLHSLDVTNDLKVLGNLEIKGTTTSIDTVNLEVKDNIVILNKGGSPSTATSGLRVDLGGASDKSFLYNYDVAVPWWSVGDDTDKRRLLEAAETGNSYVPKLNTVPAYDANGRLSFSAGFSSNITTQLRNIGALALSSTKWTYLSNMDQDVTTTSDVTFNSVTGGNATFDSLTVVGGGSLAASVSALVSASQVLYEEITVVSTVVDITLTLPSNFTKKGQSYVVYAKFLPNPRKITVVGSGTDTVEGNVDFELTKVGQHVTFTSVGDGDWLVF